MEPCRCFSTHLDWLHSCGHFTQGHASLLQGHLSKYSPHVPHDHHRRIGCARKIVAEGGHTSGRDRPFKLDGRAREELEFLARLIEVIDEHRATLRGRVVKELVTAMNDLLIRFHDGDFDAQAVIDSDMDLQVNLLQRNVPLSNLSGAAKDSRGVGLREARHLVSQLP
jgi:hypothetical protein